MTMYDDSRVVTLLREIEPPMGPADRLLDVRRRARRSESRRASALAGVMAVVMTAGVVSAISLGGRGNTETLSVAGAANATAAAGSAMFSMEMTVTKSANPSLAVGPLMTLKGPGRFDGSRFSLVGTFMKQPLELRGIGKDRWFKTVLPAGFGTSQQKPWTHSVETGKPSTTVLGDFNSADPTELLDVLKSKGETVSQVQVGDRTKTVLRLPADEFGGFGGAPGSQTEVTVLSDADGRIRVMTSVMDAAGLGTTRTTIRYDDFGIEFDVRPPPADQVQEQSDVTSSFSKDFTATIGSSSASTKQACEQVRSFLKSRPAPTNDQERQQQAQFDQTVAKICAKG
jgi:hypothetical protein